MTTANVGGGVLDCESPSLPTSAFVWTPTEEHALPVYAHARKASGISVEERQ
jgi:hypothetical protein